MEPGYLDASRPAVCDPGARRSDRLHEQGSVSKSVTNTNLNTNPKLFGEDEDGTNKDYGSFYEREMAME